MEMHMAGLKRDLAQAAEDVDTAKGKLSQLKKLAEERLKSDRAKYLAHIEELKQAREEAPAAEGGVPHPDAPPPPSMEPLEASLLSLGDDGEDREEEEAAGADADFETPEVLNKVAASMGSMLKSLW